MSGKLQNVVVLAASGNLGPSIVNELLAAGYTVTATTRQESKATFADGVKVAKTDYSEDSLVSIFKGQDAVVSIAGATQLGEQTSYVDAAIKAGVKRFIPSEFGGDTTNEALGKALHLFGIKKNVVEYLRTKESEGLSWTGIWTGPFFDWGLRAGSFGFDLSTKTAAIYDGGKTPISATNLATIGKAVAAVLAKPDITANRYIQVETANVTQTELLNEFEAASGSKWTVKQLDSVAEREKATAEYAKGNHAAGYAVLKSYLLGRQDPSEKPNGAVGLWNDKLGLPVENWKQTVKSVVEST